MAKSDSFFIRATVTPNGTTFAEASIDLGAYVDALGKSVLRIHNIAVQFGDPGTSWPAGSANSNVTVSWQLTTQTQTQAVNMSNKSLVSSGRLLMNQGAASEYTNVTDIVDVAPQQWTNGYLIGVEQMYLGVVETAARFDAISVVMECTVETLSQSAAMALALSQQ